MATLLLSSIGGMVAGSATEFMGAAAGYYLDRQIFGRDAASGSSKHRIESTQTQNATYDKKIPIIFGSAKVAGNIIWASPVYESSFAAENYSPGQGRPNNDNRNMQSNRYISLAIGLCEGEVDSVDRIWVDNKPLDESGLNIKRYLGGETQLPDTRMSSSSPMTPAYRGLCYVMIEDFPLTGNSRIPSFMFEVTCIKKYLSKDGLPKRIAAITLLPAGEFSYDTTIQSNISTYDYLGEIYNKGSSSRINNHSNKEQADALLSIDMMQATFTNLKWVSVVVYWYASSLDCGRCKISPAVECNKGILTLPDQWSAAGIGRQQAQLIMLDQNNQPIYHGTSSDVSLMNLLSELKRRQYKIFLRPEILVNDPAKPCRSNISGSPASIANFLANNSEYVKFITHYASLTKDYINAISIGSMLKGITSAIDEQGKFPGIEGLCRLAATVKNIVNAQTIITYAADWSEYHAASSDYSMDALWSSPAVDVVGIEAYFPLIDGPQEDIGYDSKAIESGWSSGEGYDYYYPDPGNRTQKSSFGSQAQAWKNIDYWWVSDHTKTDGSKSDWLPKMKKIWFTAFGFGSVGACASQPYIFYDQFGSGQQFPQYSWGNADVSAQLTAIRGTLDKWHQSDCIDQMFLWHWDSRPYPYFPGLIKAWPDTDNWLFSHAVQGKLGILSLKDVIVSLFTRLNLDISADDLRNTGVEGLIIDGATTLSNIIAALSGCYFFDVAQKNASLRASSRFSAQSVSVPDDDLIMQNQKHSFSIKKSGVDTLPTAINLKYLSKTDDYSITATKASRGAAFNISKTIAVSIPAVFNAPYAQSIATSILENIWQERDTYTLHLPLRYLSMTPGDVISLTLGRQNLLLRITEIKLGNILKIQAVAHRRYDCHQSVNTTDYRGGAMEIAPKNDGIIFKALDLPNTDGQPGITIAVCPAGEYWAGAAIYLISNNYPQERELIASTITPSTMGRATGALNHPEAFGVTDNLNSIVVILYNGELSSATEEALLNNANMAVIGNEILQFGVAQLIADKTYKLSNLIRGRMGTESNAFSHQDGEDFILLDQRTIFAPCGSDKIGQTISMQALLINPIIARVTHFDASPGASLNLSYQANALKPYEVVNIINSITPENDIKISWTRRCRINGALRDFIDVALDEEFEKYEIDILRPDGAVARTLFISNQANAVYAASEHIADFGALQSSLKLIVYQISAIVGRGTGSAAQVNITINQ